MYLLWEKIQFCFLTFCHDLYFSLQSYREKLSYKRRNENTCYNIVVVLIKYIIPQPLPPPHCCVFIVIKFQVSWIRQADLHILTVGEISYTNSLKFFPTHPPGSDEWNLRLRNYLTFLEMLNISVVVYKKIFQDNKSRSVRLRSLWMSN